MITLSRNQIGLRGELRCEVCRGVIASGDRFYDVSYKLKTQGGGSVLITKLYHFNCVQPTEYVTSPETKAIQEKLTSVIAEREAAEEELEEAEQSLSNLIAEESSLRRKLS